MSAQLQVNEHGVIVEGYEAVRLPGKRSAQPMAEIRFAEILPGWWTWATSLSLAFAGCSSPLKTDSPQKFVKTREQCIEAGIKRLGADLDSHCRCNNRQGNPSGEVREVRAWLTGLTTPAASTQLDLFGAAA